MSTLRCNKLKSRNVISNVYEVPVHFMKRVFPEGNVRANDRITKFINLLQEIQRKLLIEKLEPRRVHCFFLYITSEKNLKIRLNNSALYVLYM